MRLLLSAFPLFWLIASNDPHVERRPLGQQPAGRVVRPDQGDRLMFCDAPGLSVNIKIDSASTGAMRFAMGTAEVAAGLSNVGVHRGRRGHLLLWRPGGCDSWRRHDCCGPGSHDVCAAWRQTWLRESRADRHAVRMGRRTGRACFTVPGCGSTTGHGLPSATVAAPFERRTKRLRPNKRLKLAGGDRSKGSGVLCPGGHGLSSITLAPAGEAPAA